MAVDFRLRTRIGAELAGIQEELQRSRQNDPLTASIRTWHQDFYSQFRASDCEREILDVFITRMQGLLHGRAGETPLDPTRILSDAPLDEGSVLGTDRNTYGEKALKLYLYAIPERDRTRFPFQPDNASDFTVVPHSLAQHMVRWLDRNEHRDRNLEQEKLYDILRDRGELPPLPTVRTVRANRYLERIAQQQRLAEEAEMAQLEHNLAQFREENRAAAREQLIPLQHQMEQNETERNERVQTIWEDHAQFHQRTHAQIDDLDRQLNAVDQEYSSLDRQIQATESRMQDLEKSQVDLKKAIDAACQPPPRRKHRTGKVVASIALAAFCKVTIPF